MTDAADGLNGPDAVSDTHDDGPPDADAAETPHADAAGPPYTDDGSSPDPPVADDLHERPVELLQHLVRFDTTNPPGDERPCVEWVADVLAAYGVESDLVARDPERPNLVARLPGGDAPPLLLYGHVDVVPTTGQDWTHPPFEGRVADGSVWGRGTLDMKGGVAMLLSAFLRAAATDADLAGDLVLCLLADEEDGGDDGAAFVVSEHPDLVADAEYALGEFGGFTMDLAGQQFYPVQVAEKQVCWLELTFTGPAGHGSLPSTDDAMARMGRAVAALDDATLPVHVTPPARRMFSAVAEELSPPASWVVRGLLRPPLTRPLLGLLDRLGEDTDTLAALLRNTVNATVVRGGGKENVVPETVTLSLDVRLLPGFGPDDAVREVRAVVGDGPEIEVVRYGEGPPAAEMGQFDLLAGVLEDADPDGAVVPLLLSGASDARHFSDIGIQTYGFTPMQLPDDFDFTERIHAADERIPVEAVEWGSERVFEAVARYEG